MFVILSKMDDDYLEKMTEQLIATELILGTGARYSCREAYMIAQAFLDFPSEVTEIDLIETTPDTLSQDGYLPILLTHLQTTVCGKIHSLFFSGLCWRNFKDPVVWHNALTSFPSIQNLELSNIQCTEAQFFSIIDSLPSEMRLFWTRGMRIDEYEAHAGEFVPSYDNPREIRAGERGPQASMVNMEIATHTDLVLFSRVASRHSHLKISGVDDLRVRRYGLARPAWDTYIGARLSAIMHAIVEPGQIPTLHLGPFDFDKENPPAPLFLKCIVDLKIAVSLFSEGPSLDWWTSTLNKLAVPCSIETLEIRVEVDTDALPTGASFMVDVPREWVTFDEALCRAAPVIERIKLSLCGLTDKRHPENYNWGDLMEWLEDVCIKSAQEVYEKKGPSYFESEVVD
ncbi:uncharacterized protein EV420DRAFT_1535729 [Desarmillaria tabescens]|uniref:Uncharacterized protein n=1 Tax=Armillaria tabescens TaxID=1929756 RepID=A0AA39KIZ4_ARMTA|nr:uncharacterized protein EV420DRAFT_1535729 [Desarmillaria tabescens]KAK0460228.1 hypothetical protein EV420DRAFT_1535729 [Desarmillaria tabescens]